MGKRGQSYTKEFKTNAVRILKEGDTSLGKTAARIGVCASTLSGWVKQDEVDRGNGNSDALTSSEKDELRRLQKENKILKMERDLLKKATAFFAKESK